MSNTIRLSLISVALLSQLNAQTITLAPLDVISTAIKTDELKSTSAVEVYTAKDIDNAKAQSVYEFLNKNTSLTAISSYGNQYTQLVDIHGYGTSNGNQNVVITINGRKINNIDSSPQLLSSISIKSIEKIEIIKSSGIVVGGDGANAGIINIVTRKDNNKELSLFAGSYNTLDGSFYVGHTSEKLFISASAATQKTDGMRKINSGDTDESEFSTGNFDLTYTPLEDLELRLGANFANIDVIYSGYLTSAQYKDDVTQAGSLTTHQKFTTKSANAGTTYFFNEDMSLNIDTSLEKKTSDYVPSSGESKYDYSSTKVSLDYITDDLSIVLGYDTFFGDRAQSGNTTTKNNNALFLMNEFYLGTQTIKAGYRFEKVDYRYKDSAKDLKQDDTLHGAELAYNYTLDNLSSVFANYSYSYQTPSIDTFFKTDYSNWPIVSSDFNEFIDPMMVNTITFGYNHITSTNKFKISAYYIDLKNEIYLHKPDFKNTNIDKSHKYGLDLYDAFVINKNFNLTFNYNYVQAIIDDEIIDRGDFSGNVDDYSGNKLPGVSDHSAKLTINYIPLDDSIIALTQTYRSEAYAADDFNNNFSQKQDAYNSTDISATYSEKNWEVFAKINNIFNVKNGLWVQDDAIYPVNFTTTAMLGLKLTY